MSVRNSYCFISDRSKTKNLPANDHVYKNWNKSHASMEADMIVEGSSDGDSSVMHQLEKAKPYGPAFVIQKIVCVNHILRNYLIWLQYISSRTKNASWRCSIRKSLSSLCNHWSYQIQE
ncbi:hypothetical protein PR048_002812 [Dryococelus australis]|uniref:Mutator-like transposase domain-containing protein n=1 Tax=Dryococelus australis TaxID=614101 RepID=A0ABQ9IL89_9NEOP|nr:hypothetical protein PR048_002812 [Dryococelus australis]